MSKAEPQAGADRVRPARALTYPDRLPRPTRHHAHHASIGDRHCRAIRDPRRGYAGAGATPIRRRLIALPRPRPADAERIPQRIGTTGTKGLAAARRLANHRRTGPGKERAPRPSDDPLREPFARCPALSVAVRRAESLRAEQRDQRAESTAALLPRHELRFFLSRIQRRAEARVDDDRRTRGASHALRHDTA